MHLYRLCVGQKAINMVQRESFDQSTILITAQARGATPLWAHQLPAEGKKKIRFSEFKMHPLSMGTSFPICCWSGGALVETTECSSTRGKQSTWPHIQPALAPPLTSESSSHPVQAVYPPHGQRSTTPFQQLFLYSGSTFRELQLGCLKRFRYNTVIRINLNRRKKKVRRKLECQHCFHLSVSHVKSQTLLSHRI